MAGTLVKRAQLGRGLLHLVYAVTWQDAAFIAASAAAVVNLGSVLPADAEVVSAWTKLDEAFTSGGGVTGITAEAGTSADNDAFVTAGEVLSGSPTLTRRHIKGAWVTADGAQLVARFAAAGGNFGNGSATNLTGGKIKIHVVIAVAKDVA
jgi:hypothetical protein